MRARHMYATRLIARSRHRGSEMIGLSRLSPSFLDHPELSGSVNRTKKL